MGVGRSVARSVVSRPGVHTITRSHVHTCTRAHSRLDQKIFFFFLHRPRREARKKCGVCDRVSSPPSSLHLYRNLQHRARHLPTVVLRKPPDVAVAVAVAGRGGGLRVCDDRRFFSSSLGSMLCSRSSSCRGPRGLCRRTLALFVLVSATSHRVCVCAHARACVCPGRRRGCQGGDHRARAPVFVGQPLGG